MKLIHANPTLTRTSLTRKSKHANLHSNINKLPRSWNVLSSWMAQSSPSRTPLVTKEGRGTSSSLARSQLWELDSRSPSGLTGQDPASRRTSDTQLPALSTCQETQPPASLGPPRFSFGEKCLLNIEWTFPLPTPSMVFIDSPVTAFRS